MNTTVNENDFVGDREGFAMAKAIQFHEMKIEVVIFNTEAYDPEQKKNRPAIFLYTRMIGDKKPPVANKVAFFFNGLSEQQKYFDKFGIDEAIEYMEKQEAVLREHHRKTNGLILPGEEKLIKGGYKFPASFNKINKN